MERRVERRTLNITIFPSMNFNVLSLHGYSYSNKILPRVSLRVFIFIVPNLGNFFWNELELRGRNERKEREKKKTERKRKKERENTWKMMKKYKRKNTSKSWKEIETKVEVRDGRWDRRWASEHHEMVKGRQTETETERLGGGIE